MGKYDKSRFKQILVKTDVHRRLAALKQSVESFSQVLERLLDREDTKYGWSFIKPVQPDVKSFWEESNLFA